jgi:predicted Rdx family selenoprotein
MTAEDRHTALSNDDPWLDRETLWSYGECEAICHLVQTINLNKIHHDDVYGLTILGKKEDEGLPGAILLRSQRCETFIEPQRLQILSDTLCRLIRPSRYICDEKAPKGRRPVIYSTIFAGETATAHERIAASALIPELARDLGRTEEGIDAALHELSNWESLLHKTSIVA